MYTLYLGPETRKFGRFLLLELAGVSRPKRKQPGKAAFLLRLVGERELGVKIGGLAGRKNYLANSMA